MKNQTLKKILFIVLISIYMFIGISTIVFAFNARDKNVIFCGLLVLITSLVHILLYLLEGGYRETEKSFYLILGIIGASFGIVVIANHSLTVNDVCFYWGILEIVRAAFEIKQSILDLKHNKFEIISLLIGMGNVALGILLCVHLENGITAHLVYLGISFILTATKYILDKYVDISTKGIKK